VPDWRRDHAGIVRYVTTPAAAEPTGVSKGVLKALQDSYREVLDATKHQDDKIGRLFTGVSFLTAAALATANLGSSKYLSQRYADWPDIPLAMLALGCYLLLVVLCVMLLINSLATPLRVPGLTRARDATRVDYVSDVRVSQIYFGEISTVRLTEWEDKWKADGEKLETELTQTLVRETHNLAVRTQFKYGRTTEAIALFNLALLSLSPSQPFIC